MKYILMDYVNEAGWPQLTRAEKEHWLGAYQAYLEAMTAAGVLKSSNGLQPTSTATTVRVRRTRSQVLDGPYADSKEQLGGFRIIECADLDSAIAWARAIRRRCMAWWRYGPLIGQDIKTCWRNVR